MVKYRFPDSRKLEAGNMMFYRHTSDNQEPCQPRAAMRKFIDMSGSDTLCITHDAINCCIFANICVPGLYHTAAELR